MATMSALEELDRCKYLFLAGVSEPEENSLRLLVQEGLRAGEPETWHIGSGSIHGIVPIDVTADSRTFELYWPSYISYTVRNESFCMWDKEEAWEGSSFRIYTRSKFLDFVANATFATSVYPGPFRHYSVLCADHIIDIASQEPPQAHVVRA